MIFRFLKFYFMAVCAMAVILSTLVLGIYGMVAFLAWDLWLPSTEDLWLIGRVVVAGSIMLGTGFTLSRDARREWEI